MSEVQQGIEERVKRLVAEQCAWPLAEVTLDGHVMHDYGADSLDHVELVMAIEDEFGIYLPDDDAWKLEKVSQFVDAVRART